MSEPEGVGFPELQAGKRAQDMAGDVGVPTSRRQLLRHALQTEAEVPGWKAQVEATVRGCLHRK